MSDKIAQGTIRTRATRSKESWNLEQLETGKIFIIVVSSKAAGSKPFEHRSITTNNLRTLTDKTLEVWARLRSQAQALAATPSTTCKSLKSGGNSSNCCRRGGEHA